MFPVLPAKRLRGDLMLNDPNNMGKYALIGEFKYNTKNSEVMRELSHCFFCINFHFRTIISLMFQNL